MPHLAEWFNRTLVEAPVERLRLLHDQILVRVLKTPTTTDSGFFVPEEARVKQQIGRILQLGMDYTGPLTVGQYVLFMRWTGRELQSPDETLALLKPDDIEATIELDE